MSPDTMTWRPPSAGRPSSHQTSVVRVADDGTGKPSRTAPFATSAAEIGEGQEP